MYELKLNEEFAGDATDVRQISPRSPDRAVTLSLLVG
jgi:hypothetical protein